MPFEEGKGDSETVEEVRRMGGFGRALAEKNRQEGKEEGIKEGIKEGAKGAHDSILNPESVELTS